MLDLSKATNAFVIALEEDVTVDGMAITIKTNGAIYLCGPNYQNPRVKKPAQPNQNVSLLPIKRPS